MNRQVTEKKKKNPASAYHHGDLRVALVAQARKMVEREGPESVSLRAVAKAAGVSQAAPYHHFKDKQALLAAVAAQGFREFTTVMLAHAQGETDPRDRLEKLGLGYVEYAVSHPRLFRLMQGPAFQNDDVDEELIAARRASAAPLIETVATCLPGATQDQIMSACAAAWSMVHGMAALCNDGRLSTLIDTSDLARTASIITRRLAL